MRELPPIPPLASSATGWSTNSLSAPFPLRRLRPRMSWISIYIVDHLKPCWLMKTRSRRWIVGTPIRRVDRNLPKSWHSGHGMSAWNRGSSSLKPNCARLNLLPRTRPKLPRSMSLNLRKRLCLPSFMVHRDGHAHLLHTASLVPHLLRNRMAHCVALLITRSISRSDVPSMWLPGGCCLRGGVAFVVPARGVGGPRKDAPR